MAFSFFPSFIMLSFWITVNESNVEAFCATLLLPDYMSHLRIAPFRFADQPHNGDGRQSLIITYTGPGRLEEFPVHAAKHAENLLQYVVPDIVSGEIRISEHDVVWSWSADEASMKLCFQPVAARLEAAFPPRFDPEDAYVSVSRREMHIGHPVLEAFVAAWFAKLCGRQTVSFDTPSAGADPVGIEMIAGGFSFRQGRFGGQMLIEDDMPLSDLILFAGLARPLESVRHQVKLHASSSETRVDKSGLTLPLLP